MIKVTVKGLYLKQTLTFSTEETRKALIRSEARRRWFKAVEPYQGWPATILEIQWTEVPSSHPIKGLGTGLVGRGQKRTMPRMFAGLASTLRRPTEPKTTPPSEGPLSSPSPGD